MRVGFEVSDLYPQHAGIYTYCSELLHQLLTQPVHCDVTLLDGLGRHTVEEIATRTGLPLGDRQISRVTHLRSLRELLPERVVGTGAPLYVHEDIDRYLFKVVRWWILYSPETFRPFIRRDLLRHLDVCHWSHTFFVPYSGRPSVVTVYDAIAITHPDYVVPHYTAYARAKLRVLGKHATRIIVISDHARREVHRVAGIPMDRMDVIPLGVGPAFSPDADRADQESVLQRYGLTRGQYVLFVGTIQPRKNLVRLATAFKAFLPHVPESQLRLVLAGRSGVLEGTVPTDLAEVGLGERLVMPGRVPREDLRALITGCAVFTYLSLAEGFGLPPLEAMACGAPVLASNTTSVPEAVGDAALLVNPLDVREIAEGLHRLMTDNALRASLTERGYRRVRLFTWERNAEMTLETYRRAIHDFSPTLASRTAQA